MLFDAAPDAWGRTIMASDEGISPAALPERAVLLKGRGGGVGAVWFAAPVAGTSGHSIGTPRPELPGLGAIPQLYQTISRIESGAGVDDGLRAMLMSSWDMGGARPKAVIRDARGVEWIVKFPRQIDTCII